MSILSETKQNMEAAIAHLKEELKAIRTGVASPALLDNIMVEVYGAPMRLQDISNVTSPESRQLLVTPYDANNASTIGKAIERANLGIQPIVEGNSVRIKIPPMDDSVRKDMVKLCSKRCEEAKVSIRNVRRDSNETARKQKSSGEITEDDLNRKEKDIQELTDKFCKEADKLAEIKEKEISTI
ncbi:MAG: ribosome recycling factor [Waddliaceae bacterium]